MDISTLVSRIASLLIAQNATLATAESCTGGLIAGALTDLAGSSTWFGYGFVTYSNEAKLSLGVAKQVLLQEGAVSEAVVREMADHARLRAGATWAIAVSGIAGPSGATPSKPVGMVCFALTGPKGTMSSSSYFGGDRHAVRHQTVHEALRLLLVQLEQGTV